MSLDLLLVDDHKLVLSGIAAMLDNAGFAVTTAQTLDAARAQLTSRAFPLLLLDINLGLENGLCLLETPGLTLPERTILLSGVLEQEWIMRGFEQGALAYIPKSIDPEELILAIKAGAQLAPLPGSGWIWDTASRQMVDATRYFPREALLTPKERTVFMLMREGKLDKQIADELKLSIHTVRVHLRAIKRKRGHNRRSEQIY